ncbi:MAG: penicillin-binding transpeptidase domain-containing protein [Patescibacteria group bacterium]
MFKKRIKNSDIDPDEIFLDSSNLPSFDTDLFEGRLEKPISRGAVILLGSFFFLIAAVFTARAYSLDVINGEYFANRSERNSLKTIPVMPDRGKIYDRNGVPLVWNEISGRTYLKDSGIAHIAGYVGFPTQKDIDAGVTDNPKEYIGKDGVEKKFNSFLRGIAGNMVIEVDAHGMVISQHIFEPGTPGQNITLSIDSRVTKKLYEEIHKLADAYGFSAGAGTIMDVRTGEVLAMTSYPEYDPNVLVDGKDSKTIGSYMVDTKKPFLNRAISGLYTPGSIVKPIFAVGALHEKLITPEKKIYSAGFISIPNPFFPDKESVFKDWKAHGWVDMKRALSISSDVYFYALGGGYKDQKGLGIDRLDKYAMMFGMGEETGIELDREVAGNIPSPAWKASTTKDSRWRLGDTYISSIGQYGFLTTPVQMAKAVGALATNGKLVKPTIFLGNVTNSDKYLGSAAVATEKYTQIDISPEDFKVVQEGMRQGVTDSDGTARALNLMDVKVAAKTGTAELGITKKMVNSWGTGYFPYDDPKYSFAIVMEKGSRENVVGANSAIRGLLDWMIVNTPEYIK